MRYDAEHKARTRARVLTEAARAIRAQGAANLGVAQVMSRAGLTHGGFYAHFPSREALLADAVAESFTDAGALLAASVAGAAPRDALRLYVRAYLSRTHRDAPDVGCPLPSLAAEAHRLEPDARARFAEGVERLTARVRGLMEQAGIAEAEAVAGSVISEMLGAVALARALPDPARSDAVLRRSRDAILRRLDLVETP